MSDRDIEFHGGRKPKDSEEWHRMEKERYAFWARLQRDWAPEATRLKESYAADLWIPEFDAYEGEDDEGNE